MAATLIGGGSVSAARDRLQELVLPALREGAAREQAIMDELEGLRVAPDAAQPAQLGYQLYPVASEPLTPPWVQLDLGREHPVDWIALVPAPQPAIAAGHGGYGFPRRFRLDGSADAAFNHSELLADYTQADVGHEGIEPFVIEMRGRRLRFLRLTVTRLAPKGRHWFFALGEIMVISNNRNVALLAQVSASDPQGLPPAWGMENLVDGRTALGPPVRLNAAPQHSPQNGITAVSQSPTEPLPTMAIDLGRVCIWDEVRIFGMHSSVFGTPGLRFPSSLRVEASAEADFTRSVLLFDSAKTPLGQSADPLTIPGSLWPARYLRIIGDAAIEARSPRFSLSEIQVYVEGRNLALGASASVLPHATPDVRGPSDLTDGRTSLGEVVELPEWLQIWHRLRLLRQERERLERQNAQLEQRAEHRLLVIGGGLGFGVLAAGATLLMVGRVRRRTALAALRTQLARDLHDEIGSNLAAIAIVGEVAAKTPDLPEATREDWVEVRRIAHETTGAMREMLWLMGAREESGVPFPQQLEFAAQRLLRGHEVVWRRGPVAVPSDWPADTRRGFLLTFKEVLANVVRHAHATRVEISAEVFDGWLITEVRDNGCGFPATPPRRGLGLKSAAQRLAEIGGQLRTENSAEGGATVVLRVALRASSP